ncbi:hypothetical protein, partial [Klebsiella pneumoniae]|uniref:hypothetical protein n=1 Tax=Klebsiella pneumoniae TaxID=573 RepID=UPI003EB8DFC7
MPDVTLYTCGDGVVVGTKVFHVRSDIVPPVGDVTESGGIAEGVEEKELLLACALVPGVEHADG